MALAPVAAVLLQRDAVGEGGVEGLVGFGEAGGGDLRHGLDGPGEVGLGEPGVQPKEGCAESSGEDRLLEARAFGSEVFGRDVRVAEGLQQLDRGGLGEVLLVPIGRLGDHGANARVVTALFRQFTG